MLRRPRQTEATIVGLSHFRSTVGRGIDEFGPLRDCLPLRLFTRAIGQVSEANEQQKEAARLPACQSDNHCSRRLLPRRLADRQLMIRFIRFSFCATRRHFCTFCKGI